MTSNRGVRSWRWGAVGIVLLLSACDVAVTASGDFATYRDGTEEFDASDPSLRDLAVEDGSDGDASAPVDASAPDLCASGACVTTMCASVRDPAGNVLTSFCDAAHGPLQRCQSSGQRCLDTSFDAHYHADSSRVPWFQAAIDWAAIHGVRDVELDPGVITIDETSRLPAGWPANAGIGIFVPSGVAFHGSPAIANPSLIRLASSTNVHAMILVAGTRLDISSPVANSRISNLVLSGTDVSGAASAEDCPDHALTANTIADIPAAPALLPKETLHTASYGVLVGEGLSGAAPVLVDHLKVAHVVTGIAYGWNTAVQPEFPACQPEACVTYSLTAADSSGNCVVADHIQELQLPTDTAKHRYCIVVNHVAGCTPTWCPVRPHESRGDANRRTSISNNEICDADVGINFVGGQADIQHNVILRAFPALDRGFGASTDGHVPYSTGTTWVENFIYGYRTAFLTDGSQYVFIPDALFMAVTGFDRKLFSDYVDVLWLQQILLDLSSAYYADTDPLRGYVEGLAVRDNRIVVNGGGTGLSLYRANWAFVGFNDIRPVSGTVAAAVALNNTINSFVYGNHIHDTARAVWQLGSRSQSHWGSCFNGVGFSYEASTNSFPVYPNTLLNVQCAEFDSAGYCGEPPVSNSDRCVAP